MLIMDESILSILMTEIWRGEEIVEKISENIRYCISHAAKIVYYRYIINTQEEVCCEQ